jgi:predicted DNA-binding ribbon-helix-helix protein
MEIIETRIPGTSRQRVITNSGNELQRQSVYLKEETWDALREISLDQRVGGSIMIARLIWQAHNRMLKNRQVTE